MLSDSEASRSESDSLPATEPSAGRRFTQGDSKKKDDNLDMGIDGRACPPKFEERRRARKFSSGEDISGCPPIYSHKAVMLSVTKHLGFMRFFTSFRMTANLLSVTWAGADVLQKFFGGRYLTTPTCPVVDSKKKDDGDKSIKNWN